jgi:C6 transcription factor Pro1
MTAAPGLHPFITTYCTSLAHPSCILGHPSQLLRQQHLLSQASPIVAGAQKPDIPALPLTFVDHAAMEFFSSVMLWFDILGAASTGLRPQYDNICAAAFGRPNSKIQLQKIMGCENWAMVAIRETALLHDWRRNMNEGRRLNARELVERVEPLKRKLQAGIAEAADLCRADNDDSARNGGRENLVRRVTNAFACGACVYLTVVVSEPDPGLPEMRANVSATLAALCALPDPKNLRSTVWPFCIAGCMATRDQQPAFEDLASRAGIDEDVFGRSWRALEVMKRCWRMRAVSGTKREKCGWLGAMESLGYRVLLV